MTDEEIVARVRGGETRLFEELVHRHQDAVYGSALRTVGDPAEAEDIAQEVFLRLYRGLEKLRGEAKLSTWLYRVTYNLCIDWLRSSRRRRRGSVPIDEAHEVADARVDVQAELLDEEERGRIRLAIDDLPDHYRLPVLLLYYEKLSYEEIAAVMEVPVKTVETRLYRARKIMRRLLSREARGGEHAA
jgi:RNA polymerase sigma-70 factor (ECF subfamily)